ncbi:MAG: sugar O-acyltransferase [Crocinitomicaceae bacterium]|nr:sugar O-acyltransferase [Crocinitomicaceae bacterium]|tara:strand:- start:152234 stop:152893 length:660 start_codon:yes stop_codon:yes gene_type:complete
MRPLVIFGQGDIAQIAKYYFDTDSDYTPVAFTVESKYMVSDTFEELPVVPFEELLNEYVPDEVDVFVAVSYANMNRLRERIFNAVKEKGYALASYISSSCTYRSQYPPGENAFILEDNTIQPFVKIGDNVTLWSGNHIGHHSNIESHNFVSSHVVISGHCQIASHCFLGVNATLAHKVTLNEGTLLGAGTIISKDTEINGVYVPARSVKLDKTSDKIKL